MQCLLWQLLLVVLISLVTTTNAVWLWAPRYTVLQVTMAMVMPYGHPVYKVNMNMGVQCNFGLPWNASEFTNPLHWATRDIQSARAHNDTRFKRDLSAGEFYGTLEDLVALRGYHATCIMKTVCEMAQHAFHHDDDNIMTAILHYVFTPSMHDAFDHHEHDTRDRYHRAETLGHRGQCAEVFTQCPRSLIEEFSYLDDDDDEDEVPPHE